MSSQENLIGLTVNDHMNQQRNYFADKLVLITGATSGIGNNIATWFLDHGARVGIVGTNRDKLVEMERAYPGKAL